MHRKKIVQISADGKVTDFVPGDRYNLLPVLGIRVSPVDGTVWSNSWADNGNTELLHFDNSGVLLDDILRPMMENMDSTISSCSLTACRPDRYGGAQGLSL